MDTADIHMDWMGSFLSIVKVIFPSICHFSNHRLLKQSIFFQGFMFIISVVVMVTWVCTNVTTYQIVELNM